MFARLMESGSPRQSRRSLPGAMLSVALHAGAILSLIHVTRPAPPPLPPIVLDPDIVFPGPARPGDQSGPIGPPVGPLPDARPVRLPDLDVPVSVPHGIPPVDVTGFVPGAPGGALPGSIFAADAAPAPGAPFAIAAVDEPPERLFSPPVEYPPGLARSGIEGVVVLEAVVDTAGIVEPGSLRVVASDHPGFEAAARRVVAHSRFRPGRVRGAPVRVVVRLPVVFRLG